MRGDVLNLEGPLVNFRDWDLVRFQPLVNGMDVLTKVFTVKQLPRLCFETLGGKDVAMRNLRQMRNAKPSHQAMKQKKIQENLAAMKAKMDAIKKKKRKRSDSDDGDHAADESSTKEEEEADATSDTVMEDATGDDAIKEEGDQDVTMKQESDNLPVDTLEDTTLPEGDDLEGGEVDQDGYESDENVVGYSKDEVRQVIGHTKNKPEVNKFRGKRLLPLPEDLSNALQSIGYSLHDESTMNIIGSTAVSKETKEPPRKISGSITFVDKFDIVELDGEGRVIDKGDADFSPSTGWTGRKPGFEFKLGERGLGYYRTGKKVIVPSNTTY